MPFETSLVFAHGSSFSDYEQERLDDFINRIKPFFPRLVNSPNNIQVLFFAHYVDSCEALLKNSKGSCINLSFPWHRRYCDTILNRFSSSPDLNLFTHVVILSNDTVTAEDTIDTVFTTAHEIQHLHQSIFNQADALRSAILEKYFTQEFLSYDHNTFPHEIDANRAAKEILVQTTPDNYLESFFHKHTKSDYWGMIHRLDLSTPYFFKRETDAMWEINRLNIDRTARLSEDLREIYDFYMFRIKNEK